jgi:hypothetical protein
MPLPKAMLALYALGLFLTPSIALPTGVSESSPDASLKASPEHHTLNAASRRPPPSCCCFPSAHPQQHDLPLQRPYETLPLHSNLPLDDIPLSCQCTKNPYKYRYDWEGNPDIGDGGRTDPECDQKCESRDVSTNPKPRCVGL